jgi:peptide/nickel transport system permease protein
MRVIARRIGFYILTAIAAVTVDFFIPRVMPGDPVNAVLAKMQSVNVTKATRQALELQFGGAGTPVGLWGQYTHFWWTVLHGNLGISTSNGEQPVTTVIRGALPWTLGLVGTATVLSFALGTLLGVLIAWRRGTWLDSLLPATTFFQAAPYFFLAFLAIDLFATKLGWFPGSRAYGQLDFPGFNGAYISDVLDHAVLPALTIVVASAAGWIVGMRNVMITTMDEDYVLIAQAKGLAKRRVVWYAARNAILPSVSSFSLAIGFIVSGALLTEVVFSYPGLGFLMLTAVQESDFQLLQGIFLIITLAVLAANLAADFVYVFLDPRVRQEA